MALYGTSRHVIILLEDLIIIFVYCIKLQLKFRIYKTSFSCLLVYILLTSLSNSYMTYITVIKHISNLHCFSTLKRSLYKKVIAFLYSTLNNFVLIYKLLLRGVQAEHLPMFYSVGKKF